MFTVTMTGFCLAYKDLKNPEEHEDITGIYAICQSDICNHILL